MILKDYLKMIFLVVLPFLTMMYIAAVPISYISNGTVKLIISVVVAIIVCLITYAWLNYLT